MAEITVTERLPFPLAKPNPDTFVTQASEIGYGGTPVACGLIYDISVAHAVSNVPAQYESLSAALGTNGANIPQDVRRGGMAVKFINSASGKYEQWMLKASAFSTNVSDWQGVDDEPTYQSGNLVKSGGVFDGLSRLSGHLPISFEGRGSTPLNKTFKTIIGHKYRIIYPTNWTVSDEGIVAGNVVFVIRTVSGSTYVDVSGTQVYKSVFNNKGEYKEYIATTEQTDLFIRADTGNDISFDVIDLDGENIVVNKMAIEKIAQVATANTDTINTLVESKYIPILGSCKFGIGTASERPGNPVFIKGQESLGGVTIVGALIEIKTAGTVILTKCTNYLKSNATFEDIQTYNVTVGINYLPITNPITLDGTNAIGVSPSSTAKYTRITNGQPGNLHYYYFNSSNVWTESNADIVMALLTNSMTYLDGKFSEMRNDISQFGEEISESEITLSGHLPLPFTGKGVTATNKTFTTIIGHKYRIIYPTNWTVSDEAIASGHVVFAIRTVSGSTYVDVEETRIYKSQFASKGLYIEYVATTAETNIFNRADNGTSISFDIIDLDGESIATNSIIASEASHIASEASQGVSVLRNSVRGLNMLGSARFSNAQGEHPSSPLFIDGQSIIVGKTIIGMLAYIKVAGTAVLCKCTNYRGSQAPVLETLQTFNVVVGYNYLYLNTPVVLQDGEAFGWSPDSTSTLYKGGYGSSYNKGYYYYNNGWQYSGADLSIAILTEDISKVMSPVDKTARTQASIGQYNSMWQNTPFQAHLFVDKIYNGSNVLIPSQSVFDIDIAYRLGFKVFELNTQITADDNGVCMHGESGKLGYEVTDLNGEFHPDVKFSDLTLAQLQSGYVYRSSMAKYRVPITDIDTALRELKKRSMIPFTSGTTNANVLAKIKSVFGNNYIAYSGSRNIVGEGVPICHYSGLSTKAEIIVQCELKGSPYIHSISSGAIWAIYKSNASEYSGIDMTEYTNSQLVDYFNSLTEAQKIELININKEWYRDLFYEIHKRNCYVSWAPCYEFEGTNQLFLSLGVDCTGGSDKHVPDFSCGNLCNYSALIDFSDFSHNGTAQDGVLTLTAGQSITVNGSTQELAKGSLHVRYTGTARVSIGHKGTADIVSDGKEAMVFTSYFLNAAPTFVITAVTTTVITELSWRASKC